MQEYGVEVWDWKEKKELENIRKRFIRWTKQNCK